MKPLLLVFGILIISLSSSIGEPVRPAYAGDERSTAASPVLSVSAEPEKSVIKLGDPIKFRVTVRNDTLSVVYVDTGSFRLVPDTWHTTITWGGWMRGDGTPLVPASRSRARVSLPPSGQIEFTLNDDSDELLALGQVRMGFLVTSVDSETQRLLPSDIREVAFDTAPSDLLRKVWLARSDEERKEVQPRFNQFLKAIELSERNDEQEFYRARERAYLTRTLNYMGGYAIPFMEMAARDSDAKTRALAVTYFARSVTAIDQMKALLRSEDPLKETRDLIASHWIEWNSSDVDPVLVCVRALRDRIPEVRTAAVEALTHREAEEIRDPDGDITSRRPDQPYFQDFWRKAEPGVWIPSCRCNFMRLIKSPIDDRSNFVDISPSSELITGDIDPQLRAFNEVSLLSTDSDKRVRIAVQDYMKRFAEYPAAAAAIVFAVNDRDARVREKAVAALRASPSPPPLWSLKQAFSLSRGKEALELIKLLVEQEDKNLPATLSSGFSARSRDEKQAILTAIAGYRDEAAFEIVRLGLSDTDIEVQRLALMRAVSFQSASIEPVLTGYSRSAPAELRQLCVVVQREVESRELWGFVEQPGAELVSGPEELFPSQNGTKPAVSPDGRFIAYVETGWGRPGGTGGFGSTNLIGITHVVHRSGGFDRVISDMFFRSWLADSRHVGTARDGYATITDLDGNIATEFGLTTTEGGYWKQDERYKNWQNADLRSQFGASMPHWRYFSNYDHIQDAGENASFSPDGRLFGPLQGPIEAFFLDADIQRTKLYLPAYLMDYSSAFWSPDGRHVLVDEKRDNQLMIIDTITQDALMIKDAAEDVEGCRPNPWSRDGSHLTFLRRGQVWISDPNGNNARQITFDQNEKSSPAFSPNSRLIAFRTGRQHRRVRHHESGKFDLWTVDIASGLATRITAPSDGRISGFDWLDDKTLIFDRVKEKEWVGESSTLRWISLSR